MPITAEVCRLRDESLSLQLKGGSSPKISTSWSTKWEVVFSGADSPAEVDSVMAAGWPGVPKIGSSVFVNSAGLILPFVLAKSKSVERDSANAYRFTVDVEYDDESDNDTEGQPQAAPTDPENISPRVSWAAAGGEETAWMEAKLGGVEKPCLLPTGSLYASPTVRKIPILNATVTIYDNSFTLDELKSRLYVCNSKSWGGFAAYQAMITDIKWAQVNMPIAGTPGLTRRSYKVVYTVSCKQYEIQHLADSGAVEEKTVGWETVRLRTDSLVNQVANQKKTAILPSPANPASGIADIYLKSDGTKHDDAKQNGIPPMAFLKLQPSVDFKFLR